VYHGDDTYPDESYDDDEYLEYTVDWDDPDNHVTEPLAAAEPSRGRHSRRD
jgi:hypothetical protein